MPCSHSQADFQKGDNREDEFLASRLLFLCTYETKADYTDLFENGLAKSLKQVCQPSL